MWTSIKRLWLKHRLLNDHLDYGVRIAAARELSRGGSVDAVEWLAGVSRMPSVDGAATALAEAGTTTAVKALFETIRDRMVTEHVRQRAATALASIHRDDAAAMLIAGLDDKDPLIRACSVKALGRITQDSRWLVPLLGDTTHIVRRAAGTVLQAKRWAPPTHADRIALAVAVGDLDAVAVDGPAAVDPLLEVLTKHASFPLDDAIKAAQLLGSIGDASAVEGLVATIQLRMRRRSSYGDTRTESLLLAAIEALAKIADARAAPCLIDVLADDRAALRLRGAAARALPLLGEDQALKPMGEVLRITVQQTEPSSATKWTERSHFIRDLINALGHMRNPSAIGSLIEQSLTAWFYETEILRALAEIDSHWMTSAPARQAVPLLVGSLAADDPHGAAVACRMLGEIGGRDALEGLVASLADSTRRRGAVVALAKIDPQWMTTTKAREAVPFLLEKQSNDHDRVWLLADMCDPRAIAPLVGMLADFNPELGPYGSPWMDVVHALDRIDSKWRDSELHGLRESLVRNLDDDAEHDRAARALGFLKSERAVEHLMVALTANLQRNSYSAATDAWALGEIGDSRAVVPLIEALDQTVPPLRDERQRPVPHRTPRWAVVGALGKLGDARAIEPLLAVVHDQENAAGVITALSSIVGGAARSLADNELRRIAALTGVTQIEEEYNSYSENTGIAQKSVDCSQLRNLARDELMRR